MKLLTYKNSSGKVCAGLSFDSQLVYSLEELGYGDMDALAFIKLGRPFEALRRPEGVEGTPIAQVELLSPIPHPERNVICIGLNYKAHVAESNNAGVLTDAEKPEAVYFTKCVTEALAPGGLIDGHFDICDSLDYESELAVIIGKDVYQVSPEEAGDCIFGYSVANDVTARNLQKGRGQWFMGKSLDTFFPFGPWIVTRDELGAAPDLPIRSYINGELRQNGSTGDLIHSVTEIIADLSQGITLPAGTIIATGTPAGVGMGFKPPKYLKSGDVVRCEIEGIGILENTVK